MHRISAYCMTLVLVVAAAAAEEPAPPAAAAPAEEPAPPASAAPAEEPAPPAAAHPDKGGDKLLSGMSIVGNDEAPKSLVIVPWKTSDMGHTLDVSRALDDGRQPVDRDVFMRELEYYQIEVDAYAGNGSGSR